MYDILILLLVGNQYKPYPKSKEEWAWQFDRQWFKDFYANLQDGHFKRFTSTIVRVLNYLHD